MSDIAQGPDWWQASDGKWYPPETHPNYQPAQELQPQAPSAPLTVSGERIEGPGYRVHRLAITISRATNAATQVALTAWQGFWWVLMNVWFGTGYLSKVPIKKAMQDFGLVEMTEAERIWYVVMCIPFGAAYFAKIPAARALSQIPYFQELSGR